MQRLSVIASGLLVLGACNAEPEKAAPTPSETVTAAPAVPATATTAPTGPLSAADLRRVCRAGLASAHGQSLDAIAIDSLDGQVVSASWRAPVDGGRMRVQCRADGDVVAWKPLDRPQETENRGMNQSGDPVIRFTRKGDAITITQTLPDGTTETQDYAVPVQEEAR